jgi:hypothetical protein
VNACDTSRLLRTCRNSAHQMFEGPLLNSSRLMTFFMPVSIFTEREPGGARLELGPR